LRQKTEMGNILSVLLIAAIPIAVVRGAEVKSGWIAEYGVANMKDGGKVPEFVYLLCCRNTKAPSDDKPAYMLGCHRNLKRKSCGDNYELAKNKENPDKEGCEKLLKEKAVKGNMFYKFPCLVPKAHQDITKSKKNPEWKQLPQKEKP